MKIALFGAGGTIGKRIAAEARSRGHTVTALGRAARVTEAESVARAVAGHDAVVSAVGPGLGPSAQAPDVLSRAAHALLVGLKTAGVRRLVVVGGAGSLEVAPARQLVDEPEFPSRISAEDYAVAVIDELERPKNVRKRITVAY